MDTSEQGTGLWWEAREVVREIDGYPHLLVRIEVHGRYFPHRAAAPFVRIVAGRRMATSWFAEVRPDNQSLRGYFPTDLPRQGVVEFGYGLTVEGRTGEKFRRDRVGSLERERLPSDVRVVSSRQLEAESLPG